MPIFTKDEDSIAFETVLQEAVGRATRPLSSCLMGSHWPLVVWPQEDDELSRFVGWLTLIHTQRWHAHRQSTGSGHLYQGRFKSFPVQVDGHFLPVCGTKRFAYEPGEADGRLALQQSLSLVVRNGGRKEPAVSMACAAKCGLEHVNSLQTDAELAALRRSVNRGSPFGDETWATTATRKLGLEITTRPSKRSKLK